ncbi:hypothetical protein GAMM_40248 [Gammaproteobacteria bacterium]
MKTCCLIDALYRMPNSVPCKVIDDNYSINKIAYGSKII